MSGSGASADRLGKFLPRVPGPNFPSTRRSGRRGVAGLRLALAAALLATVCWGAAPERAYACSCAISTDAEFIDHASVIFTGQLTRDVFAGQTRTLTFAVSRVFKGEAAATQTVVTNSSGASCGLEISGPGPFVIFAQDEGQVSGALTANLCGGSRAGGAPASLGEGRPPIAGPSAPPIQPPSGFGSPVLVTGLGVAAAAGAVVAALAVRRRRRSARPES